MKEEKGKIIQAVQAMPPPRAAAAGYNTLIFEDDFTSLDIAFGENKGEKWNAGLWWDKVPDKSQFTCSGTSITITATEDHHADICTQWHNLTTTPDDKAGIQFQPGGFFEARMCPFNWSAFWLFCWNRPWNYGDKVRPEDPMTWTNEIDILETDGGKPYDAWNTLHANTSGDGGKPDEMNWPSIAETNTKLIGEWHNYGLLWTQDLLTWFIDGMPVREVKPYPSTWQPVQLILNAAPGGVGGSPTQTHPPINRVDWVRVFGR
jgi:hypothetical protein